MKAARAMGVCFVTRRLLVSLTALATTRSASVVIFIIGWISVCSASADELIPLDGEPSTETIRSIDRQGRIQLKSGAAESLNNLRQIVRNKTSNAVKPIADSDSPVIMYLANGGQFRVADVTLQDDVFQFSTPALGAQSLSIDAVRGLRFSGKTAPRFLAALKSPDDEFDRFFTSKDDDVTAIQGFVEGVSSTHVQFEWDDKTQKLPRAKTYGLILATIEPLKSKPRCRINLADGSLLPGDLVSLAPRADSTEELFLTLAVGKEQTLTIPWSVVKNVAIQSERVTYLADLKPAKVVEESIAAFPRGWKRNRSVAGDRLTVGEKQFASGIGMQPYSALTYNIDQRFAYFTSQIGLSAATRGRGDCEFVILGDDKELFRQRVTGQDPAFEVRVKVEGIRELQLVVEPGKNLDFFDHANWCDTCLIRGKVKQE